MVHTSSEKLVEAEYDIAYLVLTDFEMVRLEIEGKKKKGFRRELRFKATFEEPDCCAKLEAYMFETDNARGPLKVTYYPEPEDPQLGLVEDPKQAKLEEEPDTETGTLASARQMGSKRGRLNPEAN